MLNRRQLTELNRDLAQARDLIAKLEADQARQAGRDPVTGLLNLRAFRAQASVELERARRHGRPLAMAVLDVDGFRAVNARHGHEVGDQVLEAVAQVLFKSTDPHDVACRTGADEFALLMPENQVGGAMRRFDKIMIELETCETAAGQGISVSVGIAAFERGQSPARLMDVAGHALEEARRAGGGRSAVAGEGARPSGEYARQGDVIEALAKALLERDRYTGEHSETVVEMASHVADRLGLSEAEIGYVRGAALLHDIGKVAIPDTILHKPGALTEEEWELMRQHPVIGERILRAIPGLGPVARIVRHEHERFDGGGYPDGIAGEEIPIGSRIILACDAYHAMTSDRPYRQAMSHRDAVIELSQQAGSQFDPQVTGTLIGYLHGLRQTGAGYPEAATA